MGGADIKDSSSASPFAVLSAVPLPGWQSIAITPLKTKDPQQSKGQSYQYRQNNHQLDIETRYEKYTGNVSRLISFYTQIRPATVTLTLKHQKGLGFYSIFSYDQRTYLSACINPIGESTVTEQQFVRNYYRSGWSLKRILGWTAGQNELFDSRCLWSLLSISQGSDALATSSAETEQRLEATWFDWYRWWRAHFPSP
jgi:cyanosortase A-associated protein